MAKRGEMVRTPITVNYVRDGDDWRVIVCGADKTMTGQAPGLIAARDRAEQMVEKLTPHAEQHTVVHLLDGDAYAFTTAYLHARHGRPVTTMPRPTTSNEEPGTQTTGITELT